MGPGRKQLVPHSSIKKGRRPVVLCIVDGMGYGRVKEADAVKAAYTPFLDMFHAKYPNTQLYAHGTYVGLPDDTDMGNSEVGHNCIGCGRVVAQGAKLVNMSLESGEMFKDGSSWKKCIAQVTAKNSTLHFLGLFSDGNVHSHINHLFSMLKRAKQDGVKQVRLHLLFDGRDVGETSGMTYIEKLNELLKTLNGADFNCVVASGGGRMVTTMDRYFANWDIVERGYLAHVYGYSVHGNYYDSISSAYTALRNKGAIDQNLEEFVINGTDGKPVGAVRDNDAFILYNFRGDRAIEISQAMDALASGDIASFKEFNLSFDLSVIQRKYGAPNVKISLSDKIVAPKSVFYVGMMLYDGDLHLPKNYLVSPPNISDTLDDYLTSAGLSCYAISETQKYGHVTYFFNGNRSEKFSEELDTYEEIPSDKDIEFSKAPWMKAHEITLMTERAIRGLTKRKHDFIRLNYPNPDMVGHCGDFEMARVAVECVDVCLGRLYKAICDVGGCMVIIADHGNSDEMYEVAKGAVKLDSKGNKVVKTSHSLNPVPCIIIDKSSDALEYKRELRSGKGLSSVAATILNLLGFEKPADYDEGVLVF